MDIGSFMVISLPITLFVIIFYSHPVGIVGKAQLIQAAEDCEKAQKIVDISVAKKYLSFWEYARLLQLVERIKIHEKSKEILEFALEREKTRINYN